MTNHRESHLSSYPGKFITFEGIDGAGKSSHIEPLAEALRLRGHDVVVTREPGGTELGEKLREMLLSDPMDRLTEAMLMFAGRNEHIKRVIEPALARGAVVICDRFNDSTFAYQGSAMGHSLDDLGTLERLAGDLTPDLTLFFDLDPNEAAVRRSFGRRAQDKFEANDVAFFERVRQGYRARVAIHPWRFVTIDSSRFIDEVRSQVLSVCCDSECIKKMSFAIRTK
jgi:dTMP kinase